MKITFIGCGSAFAPASQYQSNLLIESNGKKLLVDCGNKADYALAELGITSQNVGKEIDGLFLTHLHADHAGGLEWLGFCYFFNPTLKGKKPKLITTKKMIKNAWKKTLRGGMESVEGRLLTITDFFDPQPVKRNEWFEWEEIKFMPVQSVHVMNGYELMESYGLIIQVKPTLENGTVRQIYFTGDTQFCPHQIEVFYKQADLILHDCETAPYYSKVHAHYDFLKTLPKETKEKMWLYHYQPEPKQDAIADGFKGFVKKGQTFEF